MKRFGFTLAEVLITLGIIGVVAAMTLPSLIAEHRKQVYATSAKKAVNVMSNMFKKMMADDSVTNLANTSFVSEAVCAVKFDSNYHNVNGCEDNYGNPSKFEEYIPKYLKVVKTCNNQECDVIYKLDKYLNCDSNNKCTLYGGIGPATISSSQDIYGQGVVGFYTTDGMIYYFAPANNSIYIQVDVNGEKGPNESGRDLFAMQACLNKNGNIIGGHNAESACQSGDQSSPINHFMSNGWKMDY